MTIVDKVLSELFVCLPDDTYFSQVMAVYSTVPFLLLGLLGLITLYSKRTPPILLFLLCISFLNEGILKHIIAQPRPLLACATSYGMPSGHSVISMSFLMWLLSATLRNGRLSSVGKSVRSGAFALMFLPIPYSRVYLNYHTLAQVLCGGLLGVTGIYVYFHVCKRYLVPATTISTSSTATTPGVVYARKLNRVLRFSSHVSLFDAHSFDNLSRPSLPTSSSSTASPTSSSSSSSSLSTSTTAYTNMLPNGVALSAHHPLASPSTDRNNGVIDSMHDDRRALGPTTITSDTPPPFSSHPSVARVSGSAQRSRVGSTQWI